MYIFHLLIFSSLFLGKLLVARAQYLLSGAELDDGCLGIINWTQEEK